MLTSCFLSSFVEFRSAVSEKKSKMSQPIRGRGHLVSPIGPKNTNLVEDVETCFLTSFVEFRSAVSEEKSKMSQPIRGQGGHLVFSDQPEKHKLGRGWSCFLSSFVELRSAVSEEKSKMSQPIRGQGGHLGFSDWPKKHKLGRGRWDLASCPFIEFRSAVSVEKSKRSQPIRDQGGHLVFPIGPKNTNLVEDIKSLLPVKFRWIPFSGFRGEVENVSANQRPLRPSCFSDQPEKHKLDVSRTLRSCFLSSFVELCSAVSEESVENVSANQTYSGRPSCFSDRYLVEDVEILLPVNSYEFRSAVSRRTKMWKVNDGRCRTTWHNADHNSHLSHVGSCTKKIL